MSRFLFAMLSAAVLAASAAGAGLSAAEWKPAVSGADAALRAVWFSDKDVAWAAGDKGALLRSADAGRTWAAAKTPSDGTFRGMCWVDKDHGCLVGDGDSDAKNVTQGHILTGPGISRRCGTLLVTADGGATWKRTFIQTNFELRAVWMASAETGQICNHGGSAHPDGDAIIASKGAGWRQDRVFRGLNDCFWLDADTGWAVGTRVCVGFFPEPQSPLYKRKTARILCTADGGKTWNPVDSPPSGDLRCIRFIGKDVGVIVGDKGCIQRTTDGGKTWAAVDSGITQNLRGLAFADARRGWAVGAGGVILETADAGATWKSAASPTQKDLNAVHAFAGAKTALTVGVDGAIIRLE